MNAIRKKKKKNDDAIVTLPAVSRATSKKYLDDTGLGHLLSLIISFVRNYAAAKTHNHDGVYAKSSHNHSADNITSGTLPVGRGGTGGSDIVGSSNNLGFKSSAFGALNALEDGYDLNKMVGFYGYYYISDCSKVKNAPVSLASHSATVWLDQSNPAMYIQYFVDVHGNPVDVYVRTYAAGNFSSWSLVSTKIDNVLPVNKGGTGKTTLVDSANVLINSLLEGTDTPTDNDYYVCQYAGGGAATTTYHRRPMSALWTWIKSKCDAIYQPKGLYAAASHSHNSIKDVGDGRNITFNYSADGMPDANWYAVWNGAELKAMSKANMQSSLGIEFKWLGLNPTNGIANDTRAFWSSKGTGYAFFSSTNQLNGQPDQYGFLINIVYAGEVHQEFWIQPNGSHYRRGGNGATNAMPSWNSNSTSLLSAYPVGAVYISWSSTSPASLFGGSWVAITGRFPYFNAGTGQGGSNSHTLSVNEMPNHNHSIHMRVGWGSGGGASETIFQTSSPTSGGNKWTESTNYTGSNWSHNNMPAYQTLYAWRRTG